MRELKIDGKEIRVRANPLALLFYKQEFKADLLGELTKMDGMDKDPSRLDTVYIMQLIWAMAKADNVGSQEPFPSFVKWLSSFESIDFSDEDLLVAALEEATDGFLHLQNTKQNGRNIKGKRK